MADVDTFSDHQREPRRAAQVPFPYRASHGRQPECNAAPDVDRHRRVRTAVSAGGADYGEGTLVKVGSQLRCAQPSFRWVRNGGRRRRPCERPVLKAAK